jgi:hypothetical protein
MCVFIFCFESIFSVWMHYICKCVTDSYFIYNCKQEYGCFESFPFRQNFVIFVRQIISRDFDGLIGIELPVSMYTTKTPIDVPF